MRFAIGLPNVGAYGDPQLLVELGIMAERSGWDGVFIWDHVAYREPGWPVADPQVAVAALAATTKHIRLGVPRPVQQPRIPVWIAGRWPARRPFARAARWDGVFPTHGDAGHGQTMSPVQLEEIVTYTLSQRKPSAGPFDVIMEGQTRAMDSSSEARRVADDEDVGLTWWVEKLGWFRGSVDDMRRRTQAGPPRR